MKSVLRVRSHDGRKVGIKKTWQRRVILVFYDIFDSRFEFLRKNYLVHSRLNYKLE